VNFDNCGGYHSDLLLMGTF